MKYPSYLRHVPIVFSVILVLGFAPGVVGDPPGASSGHVPDVLPRSPGGTSPGWVAVDPGQRTGSDIPWDELEPTVAAAVRDTIAEFATDWRAARARGPVDEDDPCYVWSTLDDEPRVAKDNKTLDDLIVNAEQIVTGRVEAAREGFYGSRPGLLVRLAGTKILKGNQTAEPPKYLYYPHGGFIVDGQPVCHRGARYPEHPEPGGRITLFLYSDANSWSDGIFELDDPEMFFEVEVGSPSRRLSLPVHYGQVAPADGEYDMSDLLDQITDKLDQLSGNS